MLNKKDAAVDFARDSEVWLFKAEVFEIFDNYIGLIILLFFQENSLHLFRLKFTFRGLKFNFISTSAHFFC